MACILRGPALSARGWAPENRAGEGLRRVGGRCFGLWLNLPQEHWQWPGAPLGSPSPGFSPRDEEQEGTQGYSVLGSLVGPACIFLRPSIAATLLVCTVIPLPACCPGPYASSLPE